MTTTVEFLPTEFQTLCTEALFYELQPNNTTTDTVRRLIIYNIDLFSLEQLFSLYNNITMALATQYRIDCIPIKILHEEIEKKISSLTKQ